MTRDFLDQLRKIKEPQGFGFLEMIVALGVIITGVISGLTLTTYNLASSSASESRLVAANLAREAIEVIRNKRDSNWLAAALWHSGIINQAGNYRVITSFDPAANSWQTTDQTVDLDACADCQLYYDQASGVFSHNVAGQPTNYKRLASFKEICWQPETATETILDFGESCSDYAGADWVGWEIKAEVKWTESSGTHQLNVIDRLYDWK